MLARLLSILCLSGLLVLLPSCGDGGVTLNTGDVNGTWMPNGSNVNVDLGPVEVEHSTGNNVRSAAVDSGSAPQSMSWTVESENSLLLHVNGKSYSCAYDYRQHESSFNLLIEASVDKMTLVFTGNIIEVSEVVSDTATAHMILRYEGQNPVIYTAQSARLNKAD